MCYLYFFQNKRWEPEGGGQQLNTKIKKFIRNKPKKKNTNIPHMYYIFTFHTMGILRFLDDGRKHEIRGSDE